MYQWDKQRLSLGTQPGRILRLERSIADIQVSLPGLAPESARAYLCAYRDGAGTRVAVVLHLLHSDQLAFYMNQAGPVETAAVERVVREGLHFVESLGFTLGDLDFRHQPVAEQQQTWASLGFFLDRRQVRVPAPPAISSATAVEPGHQRHVGTTAAEQSAGRQSQPAAGPVFRQPSAQELLQRRETSLGNLGRLLGML